MPDEKFASLSQYADSDLFDDRERAALEYADHITVTDLDVDDALFERLRTWFDDDALVELTATIAWENASSKFNRALRVPSQGLVQCHEAASTFDVTRSPFNGRGKFNGVHTDCRSPTPPRSLCRYNPAVRKLKPVARRA